MIKSTKNKLYKIANTAPLSFVLPCETVRPRSFSHARMTPRPYMDVRTYGKTPHNTNLLYNQYSTSILIYP